MRYRHVWASENPLPCCQSWRGRGGVDEHASEVRLPGGLNCFGKHRNGNCKVTARTATQQNSFCYLEMDSMHSSGRWVAKRETISGVGGWPWKKSSSLHRNENREHFSFPNLPPYNQPSTLTPNDSARSASHHGPNVDCPAISLRSITSRRSN